MSHENESSERKFKVVDRRQSQASSESTKAKPKAEEKSACESKTEEKPSNEQNTRPPLNFSIYVQSMAHQAMMGLGIAPWPDSGLVNKNLQIAKDMIDILQIIQEKTDGNLLSEEKSMLDSILYSL